MCRFIWYLLVIKNFNYDDEIYISVQYISINYKKKNTIDSIFNKILFHCIYFSEINIIFHK